MHLFFSLHSDVWMKQSQRCSLLSVSIRSRCLSVQTLDWCSTWQDGMKRHWPTSSVILNWTGVLFTRTGRSVWPTKSAADMTRQPRLSGRRLNFLEQAPCLALYSHARTLYLGKEAKPSRYL